MTWRDPKPTVALCLAIALNALAQFGSTHWTRFVLEAVAGALLVYAFLAATLTSNRVITGLFFLIVALQAYWQLSSMLRGTS